MHRKKDHALSYERKKRTNFPAPTKSIAVKSTSYYGLVLLYISEGKSLQAFEVAFISGHL
jgi:hypothetical protein